MVELVYKFDEKSYRTHIYRHMDTSPDHITPCSRMRMQGNHLKNNASVWKSPLFDQRIDMAEHRLSLVLLRTSTDMTSTASESTIVGNTPTSSSTAAM